MYLSHLELTNFRIFEKCSVEFTKGLNLIAGENDSGKSAIVDSIKLLLGTLSNDWVRINEDDFHGNSLELSIAAEFKGISDAEAAFFLEWLSFDEQNSFTLKLTLRAKISVDGKAYHSIYAGADENSGTLQGEAREKLRVTYLRPLRDAEYELAPKRNSRFSQILDSYKTFRDKINHPLVEIMKKANDEVKSYFSSAGEGSIVEQTINTDYLKNFSLAHNPLSSRINISDNRLKSILEKLQLRLQNKDLNENLGLGSNNLLFIAAEMLLLKKESDYTGLKLALIEEVEAHLHPQSQLNLVDFLEKESKKLGFQSILTTHSNALTSKVHIQNLLVCKNGKVFPLGEKHTKLSLGDYEFLRRFLDATKANLFFANGVIMVEGDSENLFLPTLAELIGRPLHRSGVSIVNVSCTALFRYSRIFQRKNDEKMGIPVACIADRDVPPKEASEHTYILESGKNKGKERVLIEGKTEADYTAEELEQKETKLKNTYDGGDVKVFYTKTWTLEYEIACSCLRPYLHMAISHALESNNLEDVLEMDKIEALYENCVSDIENWIEEGLTVEAIGVKIYAPLVRKQASKAVTAQLLSKLLSDQSLKIDLANLLSDERLSYLIKAINYVTVNSNA